jgi:2-(1,2-epoxy-1,2-dihydrophenyl)acetyl-CoA isomerase
MPTAAIALIKRLFRESAGRSLRETLAMEAEFQDLAAGTDDHIEGVRAFIEKRPPAFLGH